MSEGHRRFSLQGLIDRLVLWRDLKNSLRDCGSIEALHLWFLAKTIKVKDLHNLLTSDSPVQTHLSSKRKGLSYQITYMVFKVLNSGIVCGKRPTPQGGPEGPGNIPSAKAPIFTSIYSNTPPSHHLAKGMGAYF